MISENAEFDTDAQIRALKDSAGEAGDREMVAICCVALGENLDHVADAMHLDAAEISHVARIVDRYGAREECARVNGLAAAEAR